MLLQVLTDSDRHEIHERSLKVLSRTGVRVDTGRGRAILRDAGAHVDENTHIVHFPRALVEEALRLTPKKFSLGGRRTGWRLNMNEGECTLLADGGALFVVDAESGERRPGTYEDWLKSTQLIDGLDEIGVYWWMIRESAGAVKMRDVVSYYRNVFKHFTKHVQDSTDNPAQTRWLLEVLQTVFGGRKAVRRLRPLSFLLCPLSPLAIESEYTDAYLETVGWDIPVAVMPMPLMGTTGPGRLAATALLGNCEVLAMLCLVQAAQPGTPFLYAPALAVIEPRTGRYAGGAVEHALLGAAAVEMARYYGLPVEATTGGSDHHLPGIQAAYERAINWTLPTMAWPDILVGPGLFDGSTVLSYEQIIIDVEIFRRCKRLRMGISTGEDCWLDDVIERVGPGGNYLVQRSTRDALRAGEWFISKYGEHDSYDRWVMQGKPDAVAEARARIKEILATRQPLPLDEHIERELDHIERMALESELKR